jgi:transitional endoplasmic reticulum ATPase
MMEEKTVLTMRVTEARPKDAGRGIARVDPDDMEALGVEVGDIVRIGGKRRTVAKVMPNYAEDRGKKIIRIDGLVRENAQAGVGEKVTVESTPYKPCKKVVLSSMNGPRSFPKDVRYMATLLDGVPVVEGDRIRANLFGTRPQDFMAETVTPNEAVIINTESLIELRPRGEGEKAERARVSYEDVGGVKKELGRIREMIELPLRHPRIFERLGIDAPKGVLLHGPPGCGKTLIARAVANETDAYFISLSGSEVMHKFYGESEAHLRKIFEDASSNAPSIIFIDEIDAMAPKREEMGGEKQVERRVVAQLLSLMDGLESRGQVIVIGATNIPDMLDPALRRPGRFDREIEISIPDKNGRLEMLTIHTRGMPLADDVDLEKLSQITHGFVGADIEALCREAAMTTLRKVFPSIDLEKVPYETLRSLEVTMDDFLEALKDVEPSALREVFVEVPDVRWTDIGGLEEIKRSLIEAIEWPLKEPEAFRHAGTRPPKGVLLYGAPGTGKTLVAKALATESGVNFISVKGPEIISKWVGESERGVREVFRKARQAAPCIVFFDEIDSLVPKRGLGESQVIERVISQFLTEMDGIEELKGVVVLAATNRVDLIDRALLRAGRFDLIFELPLPDVKARKEIFAVHTRGKPLAGDVDADRLARMTEGMTGADIEAICSRASLLAIRDYLGSEHMAGDYEKLTVTLKHFQEAVEYSKKRLP